MKINRLETHDRFEHFTNQDFDIGTCCTEVIKNRPAEFGDRPFYIFAHTRTAEDGVTQRLIWQPRLTRPQAQTNSMLFKAYPPTDVLRVIWIIPKRELWSNYGLGKICENKTVSDSIYDFEHNRHKLNNPDPDDLDDEAVESIYTEIAWNARRSRSIGNTT